MRMRTPSALLAVASVFYLTAASVGFSFLSTTPAAAQAAQAPATAGAAATYVGSRHAAAATPQIYDAVDEDAHGERRQRSAATIPTPSSPICRKPDPLVTFTRDDIAFVYGSKWKQRYFTKVGDDYFPFRAQWDVTQQDVAAVHGRSPTPTGGCRSIRPTTCKRPTGPLCDGCHSVNYDIRTKTVTEWNVGCERCHGPGSAHVAQPVRSPTSSIRRGSITCAPTTPASSAIRRASR